MLKTTFPGINVGSSALGFGCMRLPMADGKIDETEAIRMIRHAIDNGVTYIDTAYPYHGGESEVLVGKALKDGYREKVTLATKLPMWLVKTHEDMMRYLDEQLAKLQVDYVDFYLLHAMDAGKFRLAKELDYQRFFAEAMAQGKIRYPAFSFHDDAKTFLNILNDYDWKMCQVQMNILDDNNQATLKGIQAAHEKGVGVVVMEPLRGGLLADPPASVKQVLEEAHPGMPFAAWGLRFAASQPGVKVVLSGMSSLSQMEENIQAMAGFTKMTAAQEQAIQHAQEEFAKFDLIPCTGCDYCAKVCPENIGISGAFLAMNAHTLFGSHRTEWVVGAERKGRSKPDACLRCGACEAVCPQKVPIVEELIRAAQVLDL